MSFKHMLHVNVTTFMRAYLEVGASTSFVCSHEETTARVVCVISTKHHIQSVGREIKLEMNVDFEFSPVLEF